MSTTGARAAEAVKDRLNSKEAAGVLGLSPSTLDNMRSQGRGPRYLRLGNRIFYRRGDLDAYLERAVVETRDSRAVA